MTKRSRDKGNRVERRIVHLHKAMDIRAEKVSGMYRPGADLDVYPYGRDAPLVCEVKARNNGQGFATIKRWLSDADALFLVEDRAEPLVVVPWRIWRELIGGSDEPDADR